MSLIVKTFSFKDKKMSCSSHNSDSSNRDRALELISELFGKENVLAISNYNQLQLRSLIKDLGRVYGIAYEELNKYTSVIEEEALGEAKKVSGFDRGVWVLDFEEAFKNSPTFRKLLEEYPDFAKSIKVLFKQTKSCFSNRTQLLTNNGWKTFEEITKKDSIGYIDNVGELKYNKNYNLLKQGKKQLYSIMLDDGQTLELTEDHEVLTNNGYKQVKNLNTDDFLVSFMPTT